MPTLPGLFSSFENLDQIDVNSLSSWVKSPPDISSLENYIANKILYPQVLPLSDFDMKMDLAILRELLKTYGPSLEKKDGTMLGNNPFLNITLRKIIIPERFLKFVPDLATLTWAFIDGLILNKKRGDFFEDLWTVILSNDTDEVVGSVILPRFETQTDVLSINLQNKEYKIKAGSLSVVPCPKDRCGIAYKLNKGNLLGKRESALEVYGGKLGLMIDGRGV